ncbi:MAG: hypothetical protein P4L74_00175 [Candidatus Doudnabacteria bacterium]|nr:hypothetical protein [Candidatus Doudnabacteria bacterium]
MMKTLLLLLGAVSIAFGQEDGKTRLLTPRADSPTAMRRCGAELETVKAERGLNTRYVFTGNEVLRKMQYCVVEAGGAVRIANVAYKVPAGTIGWINSDGTEVVLEECLNGAECEGCKPPAPPPAPPTGKVHFLKEAFNTEGKQIPVPTGVFTLCAGTICGEPDANGELTVDVPAGDYEISERIASVVWEQYDVSLPRVTVEPGETVNVVVKNRQKRPPAQPPAPIAPPIEVPPAGPWCLPPTGSPETGFSVMASGDISVFVDGQPYTTGPMPNGPGLHTFEARVAGAGSTAVCKRTWEGETPFTLQPPEEEAGYCEVHHNIFARITVVQVVCHPVRTAIIVCGGTLIASAVTHIPIPPCGWFRHQTPATPEKVPVETNHQD